MPLWNRAPQTTEPPTDPLAKDVALALRSDHAKRMLAALADRFGVFTEVHTPGDPATTAFRDGQRSVVLYLLQSCSLATASNLQQLLEDTLNEHRRNAPSDPFPAVPDIDADIDALPFDTH